MMLFRCMRVRYQFSVALIKQLREASGSPINDCKKALEAGGGDYEKAMTYLKDRGLAQANKKAGNAAKNGVIVTLSNSKVAAIAEINCETDFVARTEEFLGFSQNLMQYVLSLNKQQDNSSIDGLLKTSVNQAYFETNIDDKRKQLIARLQENIIIGSLNCFVAQPNAVFGGYAHNRFGNTDCGLGGSILELISSTPLTDVGESVLREGAQNLAVTYLGFKPKYVYPSEVPQTELDALLLQTQSENKNKSDKQMEYIYKGRVQRHYQDNVFVDMDYLLVENDWSIKDYIKQELESVTKSEVKIGRHMFITI